MEVFIFLIILVMVIIILVITSSLSNKIGRFEFELMEIRKILSKNFPDKKTEAAKPQVEKNR